MENSFTNSEIYIINNYVEKISPGIAVESSFQFMTSGFNSMCASKVDRLDHIKQKLQSFRESMVKFNKITQANENLKKWISESITDLTKNYEDKIFKLQKKVEVLQQHQFKSKELILQLTQNLKSKDQMIRFLKSEQEKNTSNEKEEFIKSIVKHYKIEQNEQITNLNNKISQLIHIIQQNNMEFKKEVSSKLETKQQQRTKRIENLIIDYIDNYNDINEKYQQSLNEIELHKNQNNLLKKQIQDLKLKISQFSIPFKQIVTNNTPKINQQIKLIDVEKKEELNPNNENCQQNNNQLLNINYRTRLSDLKKKIIIGKLSEYRKKVNQPSLQTIQKQVEPQKQESQKQIKSFLTGYR